MDTQLSELLSTIRSEGIQKTEKDCAKLLADAEKKAGRIVSDAKKRADGIVKEAEAESKRRVETGETALKNAARNVMLEVEHSLQKMFDALVLKTVSGARDTKALQAILREVVATWIKDYGSVEIRLSKKDAAALSKGFIASLGSEVADKVTIKGSTQLKEGFQVWKQDGSVYLDFSSLSIADMLAQHVNPALRKFLREAR